MGLIKAAINAAGGTLADQWKEFFYCEALPSNVLVRKGQKKVNGRSSNTKGDDNIITQGSGIAVADGQCMIIVENGKVLDLCAEPGNYEFNISGEPTIFSGDLGNSIKDTFSSLVDRVAHGGMAGKDTRVYYFNTKEIMGNKYGTPAPIPFRVVDNNIGLDVDVAVRCNGEYSYKIVDPLLFYTNVCGNVGGEYRRDEIDSMLRTELMTAMQPAFAKISEKGIRYSALPAHTMEIADALNEVLSKKWTEMRGLKIASFGINTVTIPTEDEQMIKDLQRKAVNRNPEMAAATLVDAQSQAMVGAANNKNGAMMGFMGMNMAQQQGGLNAQSLFAMAQEQKNANMQRAQAQQVGQKAEPAEQAEGTWTCFCGAVNTGNFCSECANPKPIPKKPKNKVKSVGSDDVWVCECGAENTRSFCAECGKPKPVDKPVGWTCSCGAVNKGKFCPECGKPKPADEPLYKCDKCGWEPDDPKKPPKFCPECGDVFDESDRV